MDVGGLTPSAQIIEAICSAVPESVSVLVMVRPRPGSFEWNDAEKCAMVDQVTEMAKAGADGVVSGALTSGHIDRETSRQLIGAAHDREMAFTFHRAFDATSDVKASCQDLLQLGCDRILTAGTPWESGLGATDGLGQLIAVGDHLDDTVEMVVGGGVSATKLPALKEALSEIGLLSFHAYSSVLSEGKTDATLVRQLKDILDLRTV